MTEQRLAGPGGRTVLLVEDNDMNLMDASLPEPDGWTPTRMLKADPATKHSPVNTRTALAMAPHREGAPGTACDEFETTPVDFERLVATSNVVLKAAAR